MILTLFGSAEFSIGVFNIVMASQHQIAAIVTTPPKPRGRGLQTQESVIQEWASAKSVPCLAPSNLKDAIFQKQMIEFEADCFVVASYGKILPESLLKIPKKYPLNVHPSLLPKYRGAAPIARQLLASEAKTGVSIARITAKLDAGDVLLQEIAPIGDEDNAISLGVKLAKLGGKILVNALEMIESGRESWRSQDETQASYSSKIKKDEGQINWTQPAQAIHNQVRAMVPWPSSYSFLNDKRIKILETKILSRSGCAALPGTVLNVHDPQGMHVQTKDGVLSIRLVQPDSCRVMNSLQFVNGRYVREGDCFK